MNIVPITQLLVDGRPSAQVAASANLQRRWHLSKFGNDDLAECAETLAAQMRDSPDRRKVWFSAVRDGRVVGDASAIFPLRDNLRQVNVDLVPDPDLPEVEVLPDLWTALHERIVAEGRTTVHTWTSHPLTDSDPDESSLVPGSGNGHLEPDAMTAFLTGLGFTLEQTERHSSLEVSSAAERIAELAAVAHARADAAYETVTWAGATPPELRAPMAILRSRMSTDVPMAGLEYEEEVWDVERIERNDQRAAEAGRTRVTTAARDRATGDLVAYTDLEQPGDKLACAYQEDTLVHAEHRGQRLGMLVKTENLRALDDHAPDIERIHTWNAGENEHMLAINVALGYEPTSAEGAWQLKL